MTATTKAATTTAVVWVLKHYIIRRPSLPNTDPIRGAEDPCKGPLLPCRGNTLAILSSLIGRTGLRAPQQDVLLIEGLRHMASRRFVRRQ